jgi:hypothetical protein
MLIGKKPHLPDLLDQLHDFDDDAGREPPAPPLSRRRGWRCSDTVGS